MQSVTVYDIYAPDTRSVRIVVYEAPPRSACYEWRVVDGERVLHDTINDGSYGFSGRQYFQAETALRDALIWCTSEDRL
jgi:hypothetical protein